mmetsp:Transcript_14616/g.41780  ORF Transcript_14616/g.41780 Transcript_14616/m.41780 type:complete len:366 (+) Transcript_14616:83-1180(+)
MQFPAARPATGNGGDRMESMASLYQDLSVRTSDSTCLRMRKASCSRSSQLQTPAPADGGVVAAPSLCGGCHGEAGGVLATASCGGSFHIRLCRETLSAARPALQGEEAAIIAASLTSGAAPSRKTRLTLRGSTVTTFSAPPGAPAKHGAGAASECPDAAGSACALQASGALPGGAPSLAMSSDHSRALPSCTISHKASSMSPAPTHLLSPPWKQLKSPPDRQSLPNDVRSAHSSCRRSVSDSGMAPASRFCQASPVATWSPTQTCREYSDSRSNDLKTTDQYADHATQTRWMFWTSTASKPRCRGRERRAASEGCSTVCSFASSSSVQMARAKMSSRRMYCRRRSAFWASAWAPHRKRSHDAGPQ